MQLLDARKADEIGTNFDSRRLSNKGDERDRTDDGNTRRSKSRVEV
jgi:hypothetical protein